MNYKEQKRYAFLPRILMLSMFSIINCTPGFASEEANQPANKEVTPAVKKAISSVTDKSKTDTQALTQPVDKKVEQNADPASAQQADANAAQKTDLASDQTAADDEPLPPLQKDPLEKFNRGIFVFNDKIDKIVLKPIAKLYNKIMPKPLNQGVHNFFNNIGTLPTIANDLLQLNFYQATSDLWRFGINSTIGIAGFFDVATRMNLKYYSNDFGLTLARWGYHNSTYLVLPFFGPSTIRDGIGIPVDYFAFSVYPYIEPTSTRYELYGVGVVDRRAQLLKIESVMEEAALDRYVFVRNAYMQHRNHQIEQNTHLGYKDQQEEAKAEETEKPVPAFNPELTPEAG